MRKPIRKAILPVAGLGTRFLPATKAVPKEMLTVVDRPVVQHVVDEARAAGIEHIVFVTGRNKAVIEDHFDRQFELERTLAAGHWDVVRRRDAEKSYNLVTFADLAAEPVRPAILDVRRGSERADTAVRGSVHIPVHEILGRLDEVPAGTVWVHCAGGYRAGIVASLLHARGHDVVAVDDTFDQAVTAGITQTADGMPA